MVLMNHEATVTKSGLFATHINLEVHYGGKIVKNDFVEYKDGNLVRLDGVEVKGLDYIKLVDLLSEYHSYGNLLYYLIPGCAFDEGLKLLSSDTDVLDMIDLYRIYSNDMVSPIYIDSVLEVHIDNFFQVPIVGNYNYDGDNEDAEEARHHLNEDLSGDDEEHVERDDSIDGYSDDSVGRNNAKEDKWWKERLSSDEELFDVLSNQNEVDNCAKSERKFDKRLKKALTIADTIPITFLEEDPPSDICKSDELLSPIVSSDDEFHDPQRQKFPEFIEDRDMAKVELIVGIKFPDVKVFRLAVREYNVVKGKDIVWKKNEPDKCIVECKNENCLWRIYGIKLKGENTFQVRSYYPEHTCTRVYKNSQVTSKYLTKRYLEEIRRNPTWNVRSMLTDMNSKMKTDVSIYQAYKAKAKAMKIIFGEAKDQYKKIWDYAETIRKFNVGSCVKINVERPIEGNIAVFKRMYMCLNALKVGFKEGCRRFIGLDGCHLKSPFGGQLLAAIGRDGNDNLYPIAIAAVEIENKDTWVWFLETLLHDIGSVEEYGWTFISDRQKGLLPAFEQVCPRAHHRICVRHLYANFRDKGYKGKALKDKLWAAATATTPREFLDVMARIKIGDINAYNYLAAIDPSMWSKAYFSPRPKCDLLVNNLNESFNAYILETRDKPLLTMMEMIRMRLMKRFQLKRDGMKSYGGNICPRIQKKLEKAKEQSFDCETTYAGDGHFQVCLNGKNSVVNLASKTCTCRRWDITGIPCCHAVSCIWMHGAQPEEYVERCYFKDFFLKAYEPVIYPMPDESQWEVTGIEEVQPPIVKKQPGRPRKLRKRGPDEPRNPYKISKSGQVMRCSNCNQTGHNCRRCPNKYGNVKSGSTSTFGRDKKSGLRKQQQSGVSMGRGKGKAFAASNVHIANALEDQARRLGILQPNNVDGQSTSSAPKD